MISALINRVYFDWSREPNEWTIDGFYWIQCTLHACCICAFNECHDCGKKFPFSRKEFPVNWNLMTWCAFIDVAMCSAAGNDTYIMGVCAHLFYLANQTHRTGKDCCSITQLQSKKRTYKAFELIHSEFRSKSCAVRTWMNLCIICYSWRWNNVANRQSCIRMVAQQHSLIKEHTHTFLLQISVPFKRSQQSFVWYNRTSDSWIYIYITNICENASVTTIYRVILLLFIYFYLPVRPTLVTFPVARKHANDAAALSHNNNIHHHFLYTHIFIPKDDEKIFYVLALCYAQTLYILQHYFF